MISSESPHPDYPSHHIGIRREIDLSCDDLVSLNEIAQPTMKETARNTFKIIRQGSNEAPTAGWLGMYGKLHS